MSAAIDLLAASREEEALYGELAAVYHALDLALADGAEPGDLTALGTLAARAAEAVDRLRALSVTLGPLTAQRHDLPPEVRAARALTAILAAEAAALNARVVERVLASRAAVAARLAHLAAGRRALSGYGARSETDGARVAGRQA